MKKGAACLRGQVHDPLGLVLTLLQALQVGALVVEVVDGQPTCKKRGRSTLLSCFYVCFG